MTRRITDRQRLDFCESLPAAPYWSMTPVKGWRTMFGISRKFKTLRAAIDAAILVDRAERRRRAKK